MVCDGANGRDTNDLHYVRHIRIIFHQIFLFNPI